MVLHHQVSTELHHRASMVLLHKVNTAHLHRASTGNNKVVTHRSSRVMDSLHSKGTGDPYMPLLRAVIRLSRVEDTLGSRADTVRRLRPLGTRLRLATASFILNSR